MQRKMFSTEDINGNKVRLHPQPAKIAFECYMNIGKDADGINGEIGGGSVICSEKRSTVS